MNCRETRYIFLPPHPYPTGGRGDRGQHWREGGKHGREARMGGRDVMAISYYEVGAYGMEWVHDREPDRSRVTS